MGGFVRTAPVGKRVHAYVVRPDSVSQSVSQFSSVEVEVEKKKKKGGLLRARPVEDVFVF